MSASAQLVDDPAVERNHFALAFTLPSFDGRLPSSAAQKKNPDGHSERHPAHPDINPTFAALIFWHFIQKTRQYIIQGVHPFSPNTTERLGNRDISADSGNPFNALANFVFAKPLAIV